MKKIIVSLLAFVGLVSLCTDFHGSVERSINFYANRMGILGFWKS